MIAHFEPLKMPKTPRVKVEVRGPPRPHATAKDSQWVVSACSQPHSGLQLDGH